MAADLSSFENYLETASGATTGRVSEAMSEGKIHHTGQGTWTAFGFDFTTPGVDDRYLAAWYGFYLKRCKRAGVDPAEFDADAL